MHGAGASILGYLECPETRTLDHLLRLQGERFAPDVVVVAIDDGAFKSFGRRQSTPRSDPAKALRGSSGAALPRSDLTRWPFGGNGSSGFTAPLQAPFESRAARAG